jgi:hypothetical protein
MAVRTKCDEHESSKLPFYEPCKQPRDDVRPDVLEGNRPVRWQERAHCAEMGANSGIPGAANKAPSEAKGARDSQRN